MQKLNIRFFHWLPSDESALFHSIRQVLDSYNAGAVCSTIYTIAKDLILNGMKANQKRAFFSQSGLDIHHAGDYELGVRMFKSKLQSGNLQDFEQYARDMDLWVQIYLEDLESNLALTVINNQPMVSSEIRKIRNSFLYAVEYEDIMEYYLERADDSEGEGIGIALIIILLKDLGIPLQNFTIENKDSYTIAKVIFPWKVLSSYSR